MDPNPNIYQSERLKWKLLSEYEDASLEEVIDGYERKNSLGTFYMIDSEEDIDIQMIDEEICKEAISSDFRLIPGVGEKTEKKLIDSGICDIYDLLDDNKYCNKVQEIINDIESKNLNSLQKRIEKWYPMNHPLNRKLIGFSEIDDLLFFDIETMGLRYRPAFLIGVGAYIDGRFKVKQLLARNLKEEKAIIRKFLDIVDDYSCFVSFNGRSFDKRFILERMGVHDIEGDLDKPHFDLLHFSRGVWKEDVPNHKLITLEEHVFGKERTDDVSSAMVPQFYKMYLKKNNPGPLIPIIEHNREDIVTLALLLNEISKENM